MSIAKRIPNHIERRGKLKDVASAYGLTVEEYQKAQFDFAENEGHDIDGNEYHHLHDFLTRARYVKKQ